MISARIAIKSITLFTRVLVPIMVAGSFVLQSSIVDSDNFINRMAMPTPFVAGMVMLVILVIKNGLGQAQPAPHILLSWRRYGWGIQIAGLCIMISHIAVVNFATYSDDPNYILIEDGEYVEYATLQANHSYWASLIPLKIKRIYIQKEVNFSLNKKMLPGCTSVKKHNFYDRRCIDTANKPLIAIWLKRYGWSFEQMQNSLSTKATGGACYHFRTNAGGDTQSKVLEIFEKKLTEAIKTETPYGEEELFQSCF
ncbi:MAG: hypothetical protein ACI83D_000462 [Planctomycetota bacterium]|jgi:hypothetical protein